MKYKITLLIVALVVILGSYQVDAAVIYRFDCEGGNISHANFSAGPSSITCQTDNRLNGTKTIYMPAGMSGNAYLWNWTAPTNYNISYWALTNESAGTTSTGSLCIEWGSAGDCFGGGGGGGLGWNGGGAVKDAWVGQHFGGTSGVALGTTPVLIRYEVKGNNVTSYINGVYRESDAQTPVRLDWRNNDATIDAYFDNLCVYTGDDSGCFTGPAAPTNMTIAVNDTRTSTYISSGFGWNYTTTNASDGNPKSGVCSASSCQITNYTGTLNITITNITGGYFLPYNSPVTSFAYNTSAALKEFLTFKTNFTVNITNIVNGSAIDSFCVDAMNGTYTLTNCTTTKTVHMTGIIGDLNITTYNISGGTYYNVSRTVGGFNSTTLSLTNSTYQGLAEIYFIDIEGRSITSDGFTVRNYAVVNSSTSPLYIYVNAGSNSLQYNNTRYWNNSNNFTITGVALSTVGHAVTNIGNVYARFIGSTSGNSYSPSCAINGSYITGASSYYSFLNSANDLVCDAGGTYAAANYTVAWNSTAVNVTLAVSEYSIFLNFTANVTGNITWTMLNDAGKCCTWPGGVQNVSNFNISSFKYVVVTSQFAQGDHVTVTFNIQSNNTLAQYYEFFNDRDSIVNEKIGVLTTIDTVGWATVVNYGNDQLIGAVIRVMYYPDDNPSNGVVIQQRITQAGSGTGIPGVPLYLNRDLDYLVTVTKSGYATATFKLKGLDFENNGGAQFQLAPINSDMLSQTFMIAPVYIQNQSSFVIPVTGHGENEIYYSTDYNTNKRRVTISEGGGTIILLNGTDYLIGSNISTFLYRYNTTNTSYETIWESLTIYQPPENKDVTEQLDGIEDNVVTALLWIAIIIGASVLGALIKREADMDTGYYLFSGGVIAVGFFYTALLPVGVIGILGMLGSTIFTSTKE